MPNWGKRGRIARITSRAPWNTAVRRREPSVVFVRIRFGFAARSSFTFTASFAFTAATTSSSSPIVATPSGRGTGRGPLGLLRPAGGGQEVGELALSQEPISGDTEA